MATQITIRPNKNIYCSYGSYTLWPKAWDNNMTTSVDAWDPVTSSGRRTYCVTLDVSSVPQNAVITKYRVRFLRRNSDASGGVVELALGTATSDTYNDSTSGARTVVTSETSLSNPYHSASTPEEITSSWYTLTEPEQQSFIAGTYKTLYIYISKASMIIYEMYVDIEYEIPATSKIYVGGSQVSSVYIGSTKASAVYIGNTKIL